MTYRRCGLSEQYLWLDGALLRLPDLLEQLRDQVTVTELLPLSHYILLNTEREPASTELSEAGAVGSAADWR